MNVDPQSLYELVDRPSLSSPVMILGLEGWIDAGLGAGTAMAHLEAACEWMTVATFDADVLLDHRSRRPVMRLVDGVSHGLEWPTIELRAGLDANDNDILALVGVEPDHLWRGFTTAVIDLALQLDVSRVCGLGAYPAPLPHTRPSRLAATATRRDDQGGVGWVRGTLDVPAGVQAAIEAEAADNGIPALGIWAQVPHYAATMPYPAASLRLLEGLCEVGSLAFDLSELVEATRTAAERLDELVANSDEHAELVRQLEAYYDSEGGDAETPVDLPSGDELAAQIQQFLREQGDDR